MALVSLEGAWMEVNDALCDILGYGRTELLQLDFQRLTHPEDLDDDLQLVAELLAGTRASYQTEKRYFHQSGRTVNAHLSVSLVRDASGHPLHFVSQILDFTQRYETEQRLRDSENELRTITDNVPALIARVDADLRFRFVNRAFAAWFKRSVEGLVGLTMGDLLRPEYFAAVEHHLAQALAGHSVTFEMDARDAAGDLRHMQVNYVPDASDGGRAGFHLMIHDVTPQVRLARVLVEQALHDDLTGLPNRAAWNGELNRAIARAARIDAPLIMLFLDLDSFKAINDTGGHAAGDFVLARFAELLRTQVRASDFVARLSGDEFVVLLEGVADVDSDPLRIARQIVATAHAGVVYEGRVLPMSPSIGIAIQRQPFDAQVLQRSADEAMYAAKRRGPGQVEVRHCTPVVPDAALDPVDRATASAASSG